MDGTMVGAMSQRRRRILRRAAAGLLTLAALGAAAAAPADAASAKQPIGVQVVSPEPGTLVTEDAVQVSVRAGARVTGIQAWIGTRDVSKAFTRSGRVWTATIPRAGLRSGEERLLVQAMVGAERGGTARLPLVLGKRTRGLIHRVTPPRLTGAIQDGPGAVRHYAPRPGAALVAITTDRATRAELRVNGRVVSDRRGRLAVKRHRWVASARDGLRPGRNTIEVRAVDGRGNYDRARWTLDRPRALPVVEAGSERVVPQGRWTRLSARGSKASRADRTLQYAWRVVTKPAGSKPQLRGAATASPQLRTDVPGVYEVALVVRDRTPARAGSGSTLAAAAQAAPAAEDVVAVSAVPALPEQGLWVDTTVQTGFANPTGAVTVNGVSYPLVMDAEQDYGSIAVQLDAATFAPVATGATLAPSEDTVTISVGYDEGQGGGSTSSIYLGTERLATNGGGGAFADGREYAVRGWLQPAVNGPATYVPGDLLTFTTRAPGSPANGTTFVVNGATVNATLAAGAATGFAVLSVKDDGTPGAVEVFSFPGASDPGTNQQQIAQLINVLASRQQSGTITLLQSIGSMQKPDTSESTSSLWWQLATQIEAMGGNADVVNLTNGSQDGNGGSYALASTSTGGGVVAMEASQERTKAGGSLSGILARDTDGHYMPLITDPSQPDVVGGSRYSFLPFLYGAPTGWSKWVRDQTSGELRAPTSGESAALQWVVGQALNNGWVSATPLCPAAVDAIRGYYCDLEATELTTLSQRVGNLKFASSSTGFTADDLSSVQTTLIDEIGDVANVRAAVTAYQSLFGTTSTTGTVDAAAIAGTIKSQVKSATASTSSNTFGVMQGVLFVLSAEPEAGSMFGLMASLFGLEAQLLPDTSPTPSLPNQVELTQANAASELTHDYAQASTMLDQYGDYLVADPVKLKQGAEMLAVGQFALTTPRKEAFQAAGEYGAKQWLWGTILGTSYAVWKAPTAGYARNIGCVDGTKFTNPFSNVADSGYWGPPQHVSGDQWWLGIDYSSDPSAYVITSNSSGLPGSVTDPLFSPLDPTKTPQEQVNVGAAMPYFALTYLPSMQLPLIFGAGGRGCIQNG